MEIKIKDLIIHLDEHLSAGEEPDEAIEHAIADCIEGFSWQDGTDQEDW